MYKMLFLLLLSPSGGAFLCSGCCLADFLWCWTVVRLCPALWKLTKISIGACVVAVFVSVALEEAEEDDAEDDRNWQQDAKGYASYLTCIAGIADADDIDTPGP